MKYFTKSSVGVVLVVLLLVRYFIRNSFLLCGLLGFAKIGMRVLLACGGRASGRVARDLPKAVRCFHRFLLPARQVLSVTPLALQTLPTRFLSLVLATA